MAWAASSGEVRAQGRLARAKSEASGSSSERSSSRPATRSARSHDHTTHDHHHHRHSYHRPGYYGCGIGCLAGAHISSSFADAQPPEVPAKYSAYPYALPASPYLWPSDRTWGWAGPPPAGATRDAERVQGWAGQISLDGGYFAGVAHSNLDLRLLTPSRTEVHLRSTVLYEPAARDYALLAGGGFGYRIVQTSGFMLRLLANLRYFGDAQQPAMGIDGGLGFDIFVARPVVLSATLTGGVVGRAAFVDARAQVGLVFSRVELFAGFNYLGIGSVALRSPIVGARFWL